MPEQDEKEPFDSQGFFIDDSVGPWKTTARDWLQRNLVDSKYDGIASGNIVFNKDSKVLLIQRASHDSSPNCWEFPGGAVDEDDPTILHGAARELREEAGLVAGRFAYVVPEGPNQEPGEVFCNRSGTRTFIRFTFCVEVDDCNNVTLDPNEHQNFMWASEAQVREQKFDDLEITFTKQSVRSIFLEAFRLEKQRTEKT